MKKTIALLIALLVTGCATHQKPTTTAVYQAKSLNEIRLGAKVIDSHFFNIYATNTVVGQEYVLCVASTLQYPKADFIPILTFTGSNGVTSVTRPIGTVSQRYYCVRWAESQAKSARMVKTAPETMWRGMIERGKVNKRK